MNQLKVQNLYNTLLTQDGGIPPSGDCDFTVATAPTRTYGYIILSPDNVLQREIMYYHNVVGNRIYVKGVNRIGAKEHSEGEVVKMNDVAEIFNTFSDMIAQTFYVEKTGPLTVNVWGGYVSYNGVPVLVADTPLTLTDNATNYIKYSFDTNTITVDTTNSGNIKAIVVTLSGSISTVEQRTTKESMIDPSLVLLSGSGAPSDSLGTDGTIYINVTNGDFYKKIAGVFVLQGSIQGPPGPQGDPGDMDSSVYDPANGARQVAFDNSVVHRTGGLAESIGGVKTFTSPLITNGAINFNAPEGFMVNGKIVPTIGNIVTNSGFETNLSGYTASGATITRDTTVSRSGGASMKIINGGAYTGAFYDQAGTATIGKTCTAGYWVLGTPGNQVDIMINQGGFPATQIVLNGAWQYVSVTFVSASTTPQINFRGATASQTFWVDDVYLDDGNLTVALKTLAGTDASASNPIYVMIGGVMRSITEAVSYTRGTGVNHFNSGSTELATKEIDYFTYLYPYGLGIRLCFSRINGNIASDFSNSGVSEKFAEVGYDLLAYPTEPVVNIGRFAATLSAGAGYTWSIPTYTASNLIQRPIYETRTVVGSNWTPTLTWNGTAPTGGTNKNFMYNIVGEKCYIAGSVYAMTAGVGNTLLTVTLPFAGKGGAANIQLINSIIASGVTPNLTMGEINYNSASLSIKCTSVNADYLQFQGFYNI